MLNDEKLEDQAMLIISNAGAARSSAYEALSEAKKNNFDKAFEKIEQANKYITDAHAAHSGLLKMDAKGEVAAVDLLLTHAQDHVMTSQVAVELVSEMIPMLKEIREK